MVTRYIISDYEICDFSYEQNDVVTSQRMFSYEISD